MDVCPTDIILAPAERIWRLVTDPRELAHWSGTKLVEAPTRAIRAGDQLVFRAGVFPITLDVVDLEAPRQLTLDIALPFGVKTASRFRSHSSTPARVAQRLIERSASRQVGGATS
jgi:uncharacterized protein YndB with AHSA1/START domain